MKSDSKSGPAAATDRQGPPRFDAARLDRLLELAGPADAAELLQRLAADLATAEAGLREGLAGADTAALRKAAHVLIAVAGSVGAWGLEDDVRALHLAATEPDARPLPEGHAAAALTALAQLRAEISARRGQDGSAT